MTLTLYGVDNVMKSLKRLDPEVDKEVRKALAQAAGDVTRDARALVDPQGLSGWGSWRGGYEPSSIARAIKTKRGGRRKKGHVTSNYIGVINANAAGAIWELAGRRSDGRTPQGRAFVRNVRARGGPASRTVWAAVDQSRGGDAEKKIEAALVKALAVVQAQLNRPARGA